MKMLQKVGVILLLFVHVIQVQVIHAYSALDDARIIAAYKRDMRNHAKVARQLVHQTDWSAVGTISTDQQIPGYPMVNPIAVDDSIGEDNKSTGKIHFLLTDLDFTGKDWQQSNKVTFLFSDEQNLNCKENHIDPMEPTCARVIISGQITKMNTTIPEYDDALKAFKRRHPAATNWMKNHPFYLCELDIKSIYVLDFYGGAHAITPQTYYDTPPYSIQRE